RLCVRARLLHHAHAGRRAARPDDLVLRRLLHQHDAQLGIGGCTLRTASSHPSACRLPVLDGASADRPAGSDCMKVSSLRSVAMYAYAALLLAFILVPLLIIVPMSFTSVNSLT